MSTPFAKTTIASVAAAGLLLLSACGGGGSSSPGTAPAEADVTVRAEENIKWDQPTYTATATDGKVTIFVENDSAIAHNMYVLGADGNAVGSHADLPQRGSNKTLVFDVAAGTYTIVCKVPGHNNMKSTLTVS